MYLLNFLPVLRSDLDTIQLRDFSQDTDINKTLEYFQSQFGPVKNIKQRKKKQTHTVDLFISFKSPDDAKKALQMHTVNVCFIVPTLNSHHSTWEKSVQYFRLSETLP